LAEGLSIACFVAHPDDETVFFGGTLALLAHRGVAVHVVSATRGEGGELGEPPVCDRSELGQVRENEMRCAVEVLGARSLSFLGYLDPEMKSGEEFLAFADRPEQVAERLAALLSDHAVEAVVTHGSTGEYGHPAHRLAHEVARLAVRQIPGGPALYGFSASFPAHPRPRLSNPQDQADLVLDVRSVWEHKVAAARCHVTQGPSFVRRLSRERGYPVPLEEALMPLESLHLFLPGSADPDPLAAWIRENLGELLVQP
jgi:LmbE family N-acetylglucosaminyl deacetylase